MSSCCFSCLFGLVCCLFFFLFFLGGKERGEPGRKKNAIRKALTIIAFQKTIPNIGIQRSKAFLIVFPLLKFPHPGQHFPVVVFLVCLFCVLFPPPLFFLGGGRKKKRETCKKKKLLHKKGPYNTT